jgi:hypothetical protein
MEKDLMLVLSEASVGGEDEDSGEAHMDDANVVFGHQQEEGEPVEEEDLDSTGPLQG